MIDTEKITAAVLTEPQRILLLGARLNRGRVPKLYPVERQHAIEDQLVQLRLIGCLSFDDHELTQAGRLAIEKLAQLYLATKDTKWREGR